MLLLLQICTFSILLCITIVVNSLQILFRNALGNCARVLGNCARGLVNCTKGLENCTKGLVNCAKGLGNCAKELGNCATGLGNSARGQVLLTNVYWQGVCSIKCVKKKLTCIKKGKTHESIRRRL
jgi:hypothetical protein